MLQPIKSCLHVEHPGGQEALHTINHKRHWRGGVQVEARVHMQRKCLHLLQRNMRILIGGLARLSKAHLPAGRVQHKGQCWQMEGSKQVMQCGMMVRRNESHHTSQVRPWGVLKQESGPTCGQSAPGGHQGFKVRGIKGAVGSRGRLLCQLLSLMSQLLQTR